MTSYGVSYSTKFFYGDKTSTTNQTHMEFEHKSLVKCHQKWTILTSVSKLFYSNKSGDLYVAVETKNNDTLHFCTTEILHTSGVLSNVVHQYIPCQLMFCCDLVVDDDVRR